MTSHVFMPVLVRQKKKIAVFRAPWLKKVGSVGRQQLVVGSAQKFRVGRGALNTAIFFFFLPYCFSLLF